MVDTLSPIILTSPRLTVELARPGAVYSGSRFDWTGFITQVTLDGRHTFCVPEDYDSSKGTGGMGLCNEFGIELPVGYEDCPVGGTFPKLGIGLLERLDEGRYNFFQPYPIVQPFPVKIEPAASRATVTVEPLETRGYAARLTKQFSVHDNWLEIVYTLENVGTQPFHTIEYAHNFVGIDCQPMGPGYTLRLARPIQPEPMPWEIPGNRLLEITDNTLRLSETPGSAFYLRTTGLARDEGPQWTLEYQPAGVSIREVVDFEPLRAAIWGTTHVISAEIFIDLDLAPGASQTWTRRYEFND